MQSIEFLFLLVIAAAIFRVGVCQDAEDTWSSSSLQPSFTLSNGVSIPLIGMGIGNLPHESIPQAVHAQLSQGVHLIDTAHASNNERILAKAIADYDKSEGVAHSNTRGGHATGSEGLEPIHVVTKVWYTHLGYERTKISIKESLTDLTCTRQIYIHMLLHWPKCDDNIPWMHCEEEENNLPQWVKDAGPPPHLNKETAFKESWKALEEVYHDHQSLLRKSKETGDVLPPIIVSIGVSNFELDDMKLLLEDKPQVTPHLYQGNSWLVFHDPYLNDFLRDHGIFFQAYAVMNGILQRSNEAPNAYNVLTGISRNLIATLHSEKKIAPCTEASVLLAYFIRSHIGIIPRASTASHQDENSPKALTAIMPHLTSKHAQELKSAIPALMKGEDMHTSVSFMNALTSPIQIHWLNPDTNEEVLVSNLIHPGSVETQKSHPGHKFVAYDPDRSIRKEFVVNAGYGEREYFSVEL